MAYLWRKACSRQKEEQELLIIIRGDTGYSVNMKKSIGSLYSFYQLVIKANIY